MRHEHEYKLDTLLTVRENPQKREEKRERGKERLKRECMCDLYCSAPEFS